MIGVSVILRGRPAWIASLVFGLILLLVGLVGPPTTLGISSTMWIVAGATFGLVGLIFLILSLVTGGASD